MEVEDISDNVSSSSYNVSSTTAAHIRDTDTCTDDAHDTAMVIITAQAQLDDNESSDVNNGPHSRTFS